MTLHYCPKCSLAFVSDGKSKPCTCEAAPVPVPGPLAAEVERWRYAYGLLQEQMKSALMRERQAIIAIINDAADEDEHYPFALTVIGKISERS